MTMIRLLEKTLKSLRIRAKSAHNIDEIQHSIGLIEGYLSDYRGSGEYVGKKYERQRNVAV
ncbi:hypothetical protein ACKE5C_19325 (plasmid) [Aneurinibacillus thermoaerophilus]|uniref:Spo0E like sporulation regulatory protein n=1 Tax=Aneurinibacillus thermoaerophilus TaxID=143495 RepID=A0ABX8YI60_ANETH|nr:hypothetical protein [Aneurinibacillus thermoaerophilus]QYY44743.1 hypothetical protein K3F53_19050 [Aneurinibacillus thermoaerophilus]